MSASDMALSAEFRAWLLEGSDPSVRYRPLRELLGRPEDDPEVSAARKEIGIRGGPPRSSRQLALFSLVL